MAVVNAFAGQDEWYRIVAAFSQTFNVSDSYVVNGKIPAGTVINDAGGAAAGVLKHDVLFTDRNTDVQNATGEVIYEGTIYNDRIPTGTKLTAAQVAEIRKGSNLIVFEDGKPLKGA